MSNGTSTERLMARELGEAGNVSAVSFGRERRREARFDCRKPVEILPCAGEVDDAPESKWSFLRGELADCSVHGIGVIVDRELRMGERFLVKVRVGRFPCVVMYTVRNCRPAAGKGLYRIGAEFTGYLVAPGDTSRETIVDALMK